MVKKQNKNTAKRWENQEEAVCPVKASKIGHVTPYSYCSERLNPFGGLLGLVKFMELIRFKEIFEGLYNPPTRTPEMGHHNMVYGFIILLFIGFNRVWHFLYIQMDSMLCSIFHVVKLPFVTTYWRYVNSLGINQGKSLLEVMSALRERVWHVCEIEYRTIHVDIDTTVETIYGKQQGGRKGHNTKNRGKKGFRPVLCFIGETREYFAGKLRIGETMGSDEVGKEIRSFRKYLPGCVQEVILRGDGEFIGWESVEAAEEEGYQYIFGNKGCKPPFDPLKWYKIGENDNAEYNECVYQPIGWKRACRFIGMRILEDKPTEGNAVQGKLFEDEKYTYREFVTNRQGKAYKVVEEYDKRADSENLIGEAKREGLSAIVSNKFATNYAYFQIVMLSYNIWRSFKMLAGHSQRKQVREAEGKGSEPSCAAREVIDNTIRIARLKLLFIAAKITGHSNTYEVKYSEHDSRVSGLFQFMRYLDECIGRVRPWLDGRRWLPKHLSVLGIQQIAFS